MKLLQKGDRRGVQQTGDARLGRATGGAGQELSRRDAERHMAIVEGIFTFDLDGPPSSISTSAGASPTLPPVISTCADSSFAELPCGNFTEALVSPN